MGSNRGPNSGRSAYVRKLAKQGLSHKEIAERTQKKFPTTEIHPSTVKDILARGDGNDNAKVGVAAAVRDAVAAGHKTTEDIQAFVRKCLGDDVYVAPRRIREALRAQKHYNVSQSTPTPEPTIVVPKKTTAPVVIGKDKLADIVALMRAAGVRRMVITDEGEYTLETTFRGKVR